MRGLNKVLLLGTVSSAPQMGVLSDGGLMANIRLTTLEYWKNKRMGKLQRCLQTHEITFIHPLTDVVKACVKIGSVVYVEGHLRYQITPGSSASDGASLNIVGEHLEVLNHYYQRYRRSPIRLVAHNAANGCGTKPGERKEEVTDATTSFD